MHETAYATVSWSGTGWTISGITLTDNIVDIEVCDVGMCTSSGDTKHGHSYKLLVDIVDPVDDLVNPLWNLKSVLFVASNIDDGNVFDPAEGPTDCEQLGASVSPTNSSFNGLDSPGNWTNRCPFQCSTGGSTPSITITYQ